MHHETANDSLTVPDEEKTMRIMFVIFIFAFLSFPDFALSDEVALSDIPGHHDLVLQDSSPSPAPQPLDRQAEWTFMLFMNGDNNLEESALASFLGLAQVGSSSEINIIAQLDRIEAWSKDFGNWKDTRRFFITKGLTPDPGNEVQILGESDMAVGAMKAQDDGSLEDFIRWGCANYPADRYALIIWDHGEGWIAAGQDWTSDDKLFTDEMHAAIANASAAGCRLDLVGFDECNMAMLEVACLLHDFADVMVGSEMIESNMWPYDLILTALDANPGMDAAALGTTIVTEYGNVSPGFTMSAVDLGKIPQVIDAASNLALAMYTDLADITAVRDQVRQYSASTGGSNNVDLLHLAELLAQQIPSGKIHDAAVDLSNLSHAVIAAYGPKPGDRGIAVYFPKASKILRSDYIDDWLLFSRDTYWDDFLCWIHEEPRLYICGDITAGGSAEVRVVGQAGEPVLLGRGPGFQDPPQPTMHGDLHLAWPITRYGPGIIPAENILVAPAAVPAWCLPGDQHAFQALIGPEGQPGSILTNHVIVEVE